VKAVFARRPVGGVSLWHVAAWSERGWLHGFSGRAGGVSRGPYASLNLGLHVGDDPACVLENRRRLCRAAGIDPGSLVVGQQVHGAQVAVVTPRDRGRGAFSPDDAIPGVDALITDAPGVVLMALYADCVPVFIYDPKRRAVGLAHAGWKGTAAGIAGRTLAAMADAFGTRPEDCWAAIGPSIGPCCYEVGEDVAARFSALDPALVREQGESRRLDLWAANEQQLVAAGVPPAQVTSARLCTRCLQETFFSHRAQGGRAGRMAAFIGV
jgi:uncharacterized protein, YfiH family